ncbi:hypothetical protein Nepgr_016335 [Nepenthes gracilis]|uniref:Uncharacterized protein n=1 Tax=Nepenthes gracilis TaxID=150966 RepID=A0AAD3SPI8_NEPGR|nr:hypothetical protein Nepgr_016335 [Nepenthes gracilis]
MANKTAMPLKKNPTLYTEVEPDSSLAAGPGEVSCDELAGASLLEGITSGVSALAGILPDAFGVVALAGTSAVAGLEASGALTGVTAGDSEVGGLAVGVGTGTDPPDDGLIAGEMWVGVGGVDGALACEACPAAGAGEIVGETAGAVAGDGEEGDLDGAECKDFGDDAGQGEI